VWNVPSGFLQPTLSWARRDIIQELRRERENDDDDDDDDDDDGEGRKGRSGGET